MRRIACTVTTCFIFSYFRLSRVIWVVSDTYMARRWRRINVFVKRTALLLCSVHVEKSELVIFYFGPIHDFSETTWSACHHINSIYTFHLRINRAILRSKCITLSFTNCDILGVRVCVWVKLRNQDTSNGDKISIFRLIFFATFSCEMMITPHHSLNHFYSL